jgi:hypothetical protein
LIYVIRPQDIRRSTPAWGGGIEGLAAQLGARYDWRKSVTLDAVLSVLSVAGQRKTAQAWTAATHIPALFLREQPAPQRDGGTFLAGAFVLRS